MPVFRELWGWVAFAVVAATSLWIVAYKEITEASSKDSAWDTVISIGQGVEPLWVVAAIAVFTVKEGWAMIAESFLKKQEAKGMDKMERAVLDAVAKQVSNANLEERMAEITSLLAAARRIVKNGSA